MRKAFSFAFCQILLLLQCRILISAEHPSWVRGGGCDPLFQAGGELAWDELFEIKDLPTGAEVFVCFDGRYGRDVAPDHPIVVDAVGGGVILVENFLSPAEVQHMERLANTWTAEAPDEGGFRIAHAAGRQFKDDFDLQQARALHSATFEAFNDDVLNSVEDRIANFLQIPETMYENYLQLMVDTGTSTPGVHHDKNNALLRSATALLYLNGGSDSGDHWLQGGESLFPGLVRTQPKHRGPAQHRRAQKLKGITSRVMRELGPDDAWPEMEIVSEDPFYAEIMGLCGNASSPANFDGTDGEGPMLAVAPVPGRALFWWHERPFMNDTKYTGQVLGDMWHVGCPVKSGKKVSVQKFKNYAPGTAECQRLPWCKEAWLRLQRSAAPRSDL